MHSAPKLINSLWEGLTARQKEIITGRYGLDKFSEPQTLAALGERYGITRERVRQIEAATALILKEKILATPALVDLLERSKKHLRASGGIAKEDALLVHQSQGIDGLTNRHVMFLIGTTGAFHLYPEDEQFWSFYYSDAPTYKAAVQTIDQFIKFIRPMKDEILHGGFSAQLKAFIKKENATGAYVQNALLVSKKISVNPYGDMGLTEWPEINPSTIRDRIYLVLKKDGKPLHFEAIANAINKVNFEARPALVPTVHNELIKDARFVLVGRGMYALSEQGYEPGTAKEVIHKILKENGPLASGDIILAVQGERFFKTNTIIANLQNKQLFKRREDGKYQIREA